jgi:hypothetical protein
MFTCKRQQLALDKQSHGNDNQRGNQAEGRYFMHASTHSAVSVYEDPDSWGGVLSILGSQEEARRCEDNTSQVSKNAHVIGENQEETEGVAVAEAKR